MKKVICTGICKLLMVACLLVVPLAPGSVSASSGAYLIGDASLACLEIEGKVTNAFRGNATECKVELLCGNKVLSVVTLKKGKRKFKFLLRKNTNYAIRISINGHINRVISVDTNIPHEPPGLYRFAFKTELPDCKDVTAKNKDAMDFPIAMIYFNAEKGYFYYRKIQDA